jgi:hypothetical protein
MVSLAWLGSKVFRKLGVVNNFLDVKRFKCLSCHKQHILWIFRLPIESTHDSVPSFWEVLRDFVKGPISLLGGLMHDWLLVLTEGHSEELVLLPISCFFGLL